MAVDPEDITVLLDLLVFFFFQVIIVYTFEIVFVYVFVYAGQQVHVFRVWVKSA